jgi:UDP-3-O-[3-hydroxymyristoyl] glucosamine N-acyltransferase
MRNIDPGNKVGGTPAQPMKEWFRSIATLERLAKKKKG